MARTGPISMSEIRSAFEMSGAVNLGHATIQNTLSKPRIPSQIAMSELRDVGIGGDAGGGGGGGGGGSSFTPTHNILVGNSSNYGVQRGYFKKNFGSISPGTIRGVEIVKLVGKTQGLEVPEITLALADGGSVGSKVEVTTAAGTITLTESHRGIYVTRDFALYNYFGNNNGKTVGVRITT